MSSRRSCSASKAVVKAASGYHVFRIEGYSLTKSIPGGENSPDFTVGGRRWSVDMYPNGTDSSRDESDAIALYLVYHGEQATDYRHRRRHSHDQKLNRLGAQYKFSLLDHASDVAYELPAEKGVFTRSRDRGDDRGCGHNVFIDKDDLEQRRARLLLKDDCLAIRCDVDVIDHLRIQSVVSIGAKRRSSSYSDDTDKGRSSYSDYSDTGSSSYSGYTDSVRSSYSDYTDNDSSSYSDDSRFDSDSDESRSWRRQNKRQQTELEEELALRAYES